MLRLIFVTLALTPITLYHGAVMLWTVYSGSPNASCVCKESPRKWASFILKCAGTEVVLENEQVIDPDRSQVLVVNHVSWFDVFVLIAHLPGRSIFVAKKELEKIPLFGRAVRACGHIFIDRRDRGQAVDSLTRARKSLENECPTIIMFPEGTRSASGELQPFKKGAFVLAIQAGVDVVPAAILGSRAVMRKGSLLIRPGTIRVRFGEPISVEGLTIDQRNELTAQAREALLGLQAINR